MIASMLAIGAAPAFAQSTPPPVVERKSTSRRASPVGAALLACWCEGFGAAERVQLWVQRNQGLRVQVLGKSGEGFPLVRGFLAAGAAIECVGTVASAGAGSHALKWSTIDRLPELGVISLTDPVPGQFPQPEQLALAFAVSGRPDPHVPFDPARKLEEPMEAAVTAVMSSDEVPATYVRPPDRAAFAEAMRVLAAHPALAPFTGDAKLWQGEPMAVVWPLPATASPRRIVGTGQRVQAAILQADRVGIALDPVVLPPAEVEKAAVGNPDLARAAATVARIGGCSGADPVVVGRVGILAERKSRPAPPASAMLHIETPGRPGDSA